MKKVSKLISIYIKDKTVRLNISIFLGLILNVFYIVLNLIFGIIYRNIWLVTVAAYYSIIVFLRYLVISDSENETRASLENSKNAGFILILLGVPTTGIIIYTVIGQVSREYISVFFIFLAFHSVFSIVRSLVAFFDKRKCQSVIKRAAHSVRLSGALMSLFNFQTAFLTMLTISQSVRNLLNFITGSIVSVAVFIVAIKIVKDAEKALKSSTFGYLKD